ncbi:MAG: signal recognition particle-docking protein FtsY [Desulfovibrionaceae bacterium]|nr:signal recognition particle-docking protein FtsY [Desulfovibrionaceae bacterium]
MPRSDAPKQATLFQPAKPSKPSKQSEQPRQSEKPRPSKLSDLSESPQPTERASSPEPLKLSDVAPHEDVSNEAVQKEAVTKEAVQDGKIEAIEPSVSEPSSPEAVSTSPSGPVSETPSELVGRTETLESEASEKAAESLRAYPSEVRKEPGDLAPPTAEHPESRSVGRQAVGASDEDGTPASKKSGKTRGKKRREKREREDKKQEKSSVQREGIDDGQDSVYRAAKGDVDGKKECVAAVPEGRSKKKEKQKKKERVDDTLTDTPQESPKEIETVDWQDEPSSVQSEGIDDGQDSVYRAAQGDVDGKKESVAAVPEGRSKKKEKQKKKERVDDTLTDTPQESPKEIETADRQDEPSQEEGTGKGPENIADLVKPQKGFLAAIKRFFGRPLGKKPDIERDASQATSAKDEEALIVALRAAEPRLSSWLSVVLDGVEEAGDVLYGRIRLLLRALDAPAEDVERFVLDFEKWVESMEYKYVEEFRSELQYRLALALELEDEEDERNRLFLKIREGLTKTREHLSKRLDALLASHGNIDDAFWDHLEELFITADLGYEATIELVERLKTRVRKQDIKDVQAVKELLREEFEEIFRIPPHIAAYTPPEVVLMVGVNGVGKTTTIGKLAYRERMKGRSVLICAADTFRAAAIEQLQVWAERSGAMFYSKQQGSDPASVAYEAMDIAKKQNIDLLFIDTAGRLQTKTNLMDELHKIRTVIGKRHPGAPHRTVLVIDATTGQNALSQVKLFKDASGVDELIVTKLDGTAKGGFAIALALQYHLPISYIGLGEKLGDLRPFDGKEFANGLLAI